MIRFAFHHRVTKGIGHTALLCAGCATAISAASHGDFTSYTSGDAWRASSNPSTEINHAVIPEGPITNQWLPYGVVPETDTYGYQITSEYSYVAQALNVPLATRIVIIDTDWNIPKRVYFWSFSFTEPVLSFGMWYLNMGLVNHTITAYSGDTVVGNATSDQGFSQLMFRGFTSTLGIDRIEWSGGFNENPGYPGNYGHTAVIRNFAFTPVPAPSAALVFVVAALTRSHRRRS
jgi:hypothetical protein